MVVSLAAAITLAVLGLRGVFDESENKENRLVHLGAITARAMSINGEPPIIPEFAPSGQTGPKAHAWLSDLGFSKIPNKEVSFLFATNDTNSQQCLEGNLESVWASFLVPRQQ